VSDTASKIYSFWSFLGFYVLILLIFIFCYWRILAVIGAEVSYTTKPLCSQEPR